MSFSIEANQYYMLLGMHHGHSITSAAFLPKMYNLNQEEPSGKAKMRNMPQINWSLLFKDIKVNKGKK